jgi:hypothetical protein
MLLKLIPNRVKVWLIKHLYADVAGMGDGGDTALAHVNTTEVALLKAHGGAGTINPRTGLVEFKGGKGGGGGAQTSTSYSTNLPEYAKPFYEELLKQAGKQTYTTDASGQVTGVKDYVPYTGERVAGFTPEQLAVQSEVAGLETPGGFDTASSQLGTVGTIAGGATIGGLGKAFGYDPESFTPGAVTTGSFTDAGVADKYMDPYTQGVVDVQKREAQRMADMQSNQAAMASIGRGTFGGGREALMTGERDRNTQDLLNKIQMEGGTNAYNQALKAFEAEQGRGLQAQTTNVQSALEAAKLGQQGQQYAAGLGKEIGLAGLQTGLEGAKATGALSATEQMSNLERLKAQAASAGEQQAYQQEIDNLGLPTVYGSSRL